MYKSLKRQCISSPGPTGFLLGTSACDLQGATPGAPENENSGLAPQSRDRGWRGCALTRIAQCSDKHAAIVRLRALSGMEKPITTKDTNDDEGGVLNRKANAASPYFAIPK